VYILKTPTLPHPVFVGLTALSMKQGVTPVGAGDGFLSAAITLGEPFVMTKVGWNAKNIANLELRLNKIVADKVVKGRSFKGLDFSLFSMVYSKGKLSEAQKLQFFRDVYFELKERIPSLTERIMSAAVGVKASVALGANCGTTCEDISDPKLRESVAKGGTKADLVKARDLLSEINNGFSEFNHLYGPFGYEPSGSMSGPGSTWEPTKFAFGAAMIMHDKDLFINSSNHSKNAKLYKPFKFDSFSTHDLEHSPHDVYLNHEKPLFHGLDEKGLEEIIKKYQEKIAQSPKLSQIKKSVELAIESEVSEKKFDLWEEAAFNTSPVWPGVENKWFMEGASFNTSSVQPLAETNLSLQPLLSVRSMVENKWLKTFEELHEKGKGLDAFHQSHGGTDFFPAIKLCEETLANFLALKPATPR
jgi:hypothetical protein